MQQHILLAGIDLYLPHRPDNTQNPYMSVSKTLVPLFLLLVCYAAYRNQDTNQPSFTFWNIGKKESLHPEIQTLFNYLDKQIQQKEKT